MNIVSIAKKEIWQNLSDVRTFVFMLAFPIVLMLILGSALSNAFDTKISVDNINVLYKNTAVSTLGSNFEAFTKVAEKSGIHFKKAASNVDGKKEVKENNYTGYVEITNKGIQFYDNNRNSIEDSIVQGMLGAFADKYNVAAAVASVNPKEISTALASGKNHDFIKETSLNAARQPGSMDYYAMAMTTMIALYSAMGASSLIRGERTRNTAIRLLAAPVTKGEIFLGKIIGSLVINTICLVVVIAFSHFVYKANWGNHLIMVILVLLTEVFLAVSLGLGISYIAKTSEASRMLIMVVIQLASFFGGAYFKINNPTGILSFVTQLSPLTWANNAITKIIYANDIGAAVPAIALNLGITALFLSFAVISLRRREGL